MSSAYAEPSHGVAVRRRRSAKEYLQHRHVCCRAHRTADRHTNACSLACKQKLHAQPSHIQNSSHKIPLYSSRYVRAFSSESATCVIRLRRPRKVYTIDDAICSLLEVIDALKNHSQALEQEGKLCNMTSAAKKSKVRHRSEVFVGCSGGVVPRRR
jgi:hypothetical protein